MKFNHKFSLTDGGRSFRLYKSENINARLDFVSGTAIRVAIYADGTKLLPTFDINPTNEISHAGRDKLALDGFKLFEPKCTKNEDAEVFELLNGIKIELNPDNFLLKYFKGENILFSDRAPLSYNFEGEFGDGVCHYVSREAGERIFGVGDKGGSMNKAGRSFRIETSDSMGYDAEKSDPLYKHVPFYICDNSCGSYGIFYDSSATAVMDFGREINNYYEPFKFYKADDDSLIYYVFFGTKLEILKQFCSFVGKQPLPPKWSFDYCASTMAYTDSENAESEMYAFLDKVKKLNISCSGFYLSSGYTSIGNQRCVFNWNKNKFPDPERFITDFKHEGINIIPNIKPAFLTTHPMYDGIARRGLFVKNEDGTPFVTQFWDGLGSYLDFTNEEAFKFWSDEVNEELLSNGARATWNDNNEFDIKDSSAVAMGFDGEVKASQIRPDFTYLMVLASYEAQVKKNGGERPFLSTRSGSVGVRRLAQTWSGDNYTSFHDLRFCHYIGLTMSLSGFYFYGHDLGGFSGPMPSKELFLRWVQHGIFEPRLTIHSWNSDLSATMPWSYPDVTENVRALFAERSALLPYIYTVAYDAVEHEIPLNAPLFLYYDDREIDVDSASFMLGENILVTPVLDEGVNEVSVYLPRSDDWYLNNGKFYRGGETVALNILPTDVVPYFVKAGTVLPLNVAEYGFRAKEKLQFTVYPVQNGSFESHYFNDDGKSPLCSDGVNNKGNCTYINFKVTCTENTVEVLAKNLGNVEAEYSIELIKTDKRKLIVK